MKLIQSIKLSEEEIQDLMIAINHTIDTSSTIHPERLTRIKKIKEFFRSISSEKELPEEQLIKKKHLRQGNYRFSICSLKVCLILR
ncbi:hypothetical protein LF817_11255 [Halobacillus sp. A1]|uniref:hypothetical protein n=1 Tax=Halobacillus sp. A1 TaxID=2880262 RepID=UPI0020A6AF75|nr:hypothetical protein [Halobacillus sp. A1]MCP3031922.1 hypothetical protein [Halobacillus sp. A1]